MDLESEINSRNEPSPSEKMKEIEQRMKGKRSVKAIRTIVSEVLKAKPSELKDFSHKIGPHHWKGIVYQKRNSLMGAIFSYFDTKVFCVRPYPKIKYSDDSRVYLQDCIAQEKIDGTNFGIFLLPDGTMMGKTRMVETWLGFAFKRKNLTWEGLFKQIENGDLLRRMNELLLIHDYVIYGELYGKLNPGDFIKYSVDIAFKVFDILDRKTQRFLPPEKVKALCEFYHLPMVNQTWSGKLTDKEIQRIEFELEKEIKDDGMEGWVAKAYIDNDVYCCKLKCEKIKEKCYEKTAKPTIPIAIIRKAVRKVLENFPDCKTMETMEPHVLDELKEEVEDALIEMSMERIRSQIRWALTPSDEELLDLVIAKMEEMKAKGIDLEKKGHVLSKLASELGTISGSTLFRLYQIALRKIK